MKVLFVDMDNVIVNLSEGVVDWINRELEKPVYKGSYRCDLTEKDIVQYYFWDNYKLQESFGRKLQERMFNTEKFWYSLSPIRDSLNVLRRLSEKFNIYIATRPALNDVCISEKMDWVKIHLPFIGVDKVVFTQDKSILRGDIMIDDEYEQLKRFEGTRILFYQPYTSWDVLTKCDYVVKSWKSLEEILDDMVE